VSGSCQKGDEPLDFTKVGEFLEYLIVPLASEEMILL
jgi:hypothetical protein